MLQRCQTQKFVPRPTGKEYGGIDRLNFKHQTSEFKSTSWHTDPASSIKSRQGDETANRNCGSH